MFSKATANFVRQIDPEGSLIHVSRPNDSHKLVPMGLVIKRNRIWFWQRPKYQPTDFNLSNLLLRQDKVLSPELSETDFLTYKGTFGDKLCGKLDTEASAFAVSLEGQGSSELQSCFGQLKKEELDVKKLLHDSKDRLVDMEHILVQQLEKRNEALAVVKERIFTTNSCTVTHTKKKRCTVSGMLGRSVQVCVKDSNSIDINSDVSLEIPAGTVIAYSVLELDIKKDGHYNICLRPGTIGGFESDVHLVPSSSQFSLDMVDGRSNGGSQDMDLSPLEKLPPSVQADLFRRLQETLRERETLSYLQYVLSESFCGETPNMANHDNLSESQKASASAILDQLIADHVTESSQCGLADILKAALMLVSAMEELPDETLILLSESRPDFLEAIAMLMCAPLSIERLENLQMAEVLLGSINVTLMRDSDRLWTETREKNNVHQLLLYLSVHGLSLLCRGLKQ